MKTFEVQVADDSAVAKMLEIVNCSTSSASDPNPLSVFSVDLDSVPSATEQICPLSLGGCGKKVAVDNGVYVHSSRGKTSCALSGEGSRSQRIVRRRNLSNYALASSYANKLPDRKSVV